MSILDKIEPNKSQSTEKIVSGRPLRFFVRLDPERFDMCIVFVEYDDISQDSTFIHSLDGIEYISDLCDDYEICCFSYDEIMTQQIGEWFTVYTYDQHNTFYIIQFSVDKMRYAKYVMELTSFWKTNMARGHKYGLYMF